MTAPKNIEQENKSKPSLIPLDILLKYLEPAYQEGLRKYYRESWRLGFYTSDMFDATIRHLEKYFYQKENWDPDAAKLGVIKHHLGGALFSILCMLDTFENHPELDDRGKDWSKDKLKKEEKVTEIQSITHPSFTFLPEDLAKAAQNKNKEIK